MMLTRSDFDYLEDKKREIVNCCTLCKGDGRECACQSAYSFEIRMAQSRIPVKYRSFTISKISMPDVKEARDTVVDYIENLDEKRKQGTGLFLWSEAKGTAKSSFASIILKHAIEKGYSCYFTDLNECLEMITGSWFDDVKKDEMKKRLLESDFVVIDDVGGKEVRTKSNSEIILTSFTTLFKARCDSLLPTIMTSNLDPKEDITRAYGERLYSMICEHLQIVQCRGLDFRQTVLAGKINE